MGDLNHSVQLSKRPCLLLTLLFAGYTALSLGRRVLQDVCSIQSFSDEHVTTSSYGLILGAQTAGYTVTKLLSGIAMDRVNPITVYSATHWMTAFTLFAMAISMNWFNWLFWYTLNGLCLGVTWPAIGKILRNSVPSDELATWWGLLSMPINVAGAAGPWIALLLQAVTTKWLHEMHTWRVILIIEGLACWFFGLLLCARSHSMSPKVDNVSDVSGKLVNADHKTDRADLLRSDGTSQVIRQRQARRESASHGMLAVSDSTSLETRPQPRRMNCLYSHFDELARALHPTHRLLLCCSALVHLSSTLVRFAISNWLPVMLREYPERYTIASINSFITVFEIGGLLGNVIVGSLSDHCVGKAISTTSNPRVPHIVTQMLILSAMLVVFSFSIPGGFSNWFLLFYALLFGLTVFGSISLCGVMAVELAPASLSGTCHAFSALMANVGAILACYPLGCLSEQIGWPSTFAAVGVFSVVTVVPLGIVSVRHQNGS